MSDISQGREKRPQMITKMLLAAMTTTAIQPQYQGCGGNKINCMFISPAQPGCLSRRKPRKEMPPVLCPSPAREPGYLVAAGLPFSRQPSVVTSLSAEPDLSLVSTGFQSALCPGEEAQSQAGVSGPRLGAHGQHEWVAAGPRRLNANKIMSVVGKVGGGAPPNKTGSSILIKSKT